ncbi:unnamed protein product [Microthlaspi erraticum]|uniref:F-box domain-containing protein n=1 Tax=Microthlaspi erraticum TaxID=1685480 RepID=A0A6D2K5H7_9BRAS|nr:unnamed protein product [Microthlaspi erraticum]
MGDQEKKKSKGNRRRIRRKPSGSTLSFPVDLTSEILLRLPTRSVVRFRCVSKLWSSITTDPYFINSFQTRRSLLLLCFKKGDKVSVLSIPQHTQDWDKAYSSSLPIERYHMKLPGYGFHYHTESVHGLICFEDSQNPVVWNPSMRSLLTLPNPNNHKSWTYKTLFLGYDPVEGKHKLVCFHSKKVSYVCRVLTLGSSQESWRTVRTNIKQRVYSYTCGRCINGMIYYIACNWKTFAYVVMRFDVRYEKFDMIEKPSNIDVDVLINYEGRIACTDTYNDRRLWILEDAEKHKWSSQDFLVPLRHWDQRFTMCFKLQGFTHAGEFIFGSHSYQKSSYIVSYDPVRNSFGRLGFKGIANDELCLVNGVGDDTYEVHAFPNHTESLLSL